VAQPDYVPSSLKKANLMTWTKIKNMYFNKIKYQIGRKKGTKSKLTNFFRDKKHIKPKKK